MFNYQVNNDLLVVIFYIIPSLNLIEYLTVISYSVQIFQLFPPDLSRSGNICVSKYLFPLGIVWFSTATTASTIDLGPAQAEQGLHGSQAGVGVVKVVLQLRGQLLLPDLLG